MFQEMLFLYAVWVFAQVMWLKTEVSRRNSKSLWICMAPNVVICAAVIVSIATGGYADEEMPGALSLMTFLLVVSLLFGVYPILWSSGSRVMVATMFLVNLCFAFLALIMMAFSLMNVWI